MVETALTMITDSLVDISVLADEAPPTASQAQGALRKLNKMIESWALDHLLVYGAIENLLPFVANQGQYTIGTGGNLNIPRPNNITAVLVRDTTLPVANRQDIPLYIYNDQEWQNVAFKGIQATWPVNGGVWFNYTYPLITANFNPVPTGPQYSAVIWTAGILSQLTLNAALALAPGYYRALQSNLCLELAGSYGVPVPQTIADIAKESKSMLEIQNFQLNELQIDSRLTVGYYDIRTGENI